VTVAFATAVACTAIRVGVAGHELPLRLTMQYGFSGRALSQGRWSTVLTSQFLTRNAFMVVSICVSLVVMLGVYEAFAGSLRALLVAVVGGAAAPLIVAGLLGAGSALGWTFAGRTLSTIDYGASAITAAGGGALVGLWQRRWFTVAAGLLVASGILLHHQLADWEHLVSFPIGWCIGRSLGCAPVRSVHARQWRRPAVAVRCAARAALAVSVGTVASVLTVVGPSAVLARPGAWAHSTGAASDVHGPPRPLSPPEIREVRYPAPSLGDDRRAVVVLPPGYAEQKSRRYPVVELLHGDPGNPEDVITGLRLPDVVDRGEVPPFIAVAPDGRGPKVEWGDWADTPQQRLGAAASADLRQWVDTTFRTNGAWSVMGLSSGGFGSAYLAMRSPGAYTGVCSMSGFFTARQSAFGHASRAAIDAASPLEHASKTGSPTLLLVGSEDHEWGPASHQYFSALQAAGQPSELRQFPGTHDWTAWTAMTPECLRFLLGSAVPPAGQRTS
jgi:enterochelin esterase-like enzyme